MFPCINLTRRGLGNDPHMMVKNRVHEVIEFVVSTSYTDSNLCYDSNQKGMIKTIVIRSVHRNENVQKQKAAWKGQGA